MTGTSGRCLEGWTSDACCFVGWRFGEKERLGAGEGSAAASLSGGVRRSLREARPPLGS